MRQQGHLWALVGLQSYQNLATVEEEVAVPLRIERWVGEGVVAQELTAVVLGEQEELLGAELAHVGA